MRKLLLSLVLPGTVLCAAQAQPNSSIVAGPMIGHVEMRTANLWMQFNRNVTKATVLYAAKGSGAEKVVSVTLQGGEFNTGVAVLSSLEPGTTYTYRIRLNGAGQPVARGELTTQSLWQWRAPAPDFSFLTGSCAYFNEPPYDRPGKPYGLDSSIFLSMAKEKAAFTLWLGDNWYTREADYMSNWGLFKRASRDRSLPVLQPLLKAMPQYAIWDDHDYGPNDAGKNYILKNTARNVFTQYWSNPSYGDGGEAVYTRLAWNDLDIFMLDDRWYRSSDRMRDSIDGKPNPDKKMFGEKQLEWLKNELLVSNENNNISFRIIATGSQVLNAFSPYDCFRHFPAEYADFMKFIDDHKIKGLIFLTGDRHHSEIIKMERSGNYPLYDITVSPFTSNISKTSGAEVNNPSRVGAEIDVQNYARLSFSGAAQDRKATVEFIGLHGEKLGSWSVGLKELTP